ncbi:hypothetical protein [Salipiger mucosus]|uniref:Hypervirulence associated protein TUDOR domain-containing protein n=1 Tax=Salipiger mucosus DSM 16094 TaxID=1123237 RepID=S9RJ41_9RHOB|nr:hypothetical protein [Salipiger mucosus]EPX78110.1 hypothetical protein Salmuc_03461 [Salipiger mucosus DSM 16094]
MPMRDSIGQEIRPGDRVLWSRNGAYAGFEDGVLTVEKLTPKSVRMRERNPLNDRPLIASPNALVVVEANLRSLGK